MRSPDPSTKLRIVVYGYVARGPLGGFAWHHLQYVSGLLKLGHHVMFVEDSGDSPGCYDPRTGEMTAVPDYGLHFLAEACAGCGIGDRWAYYDAHRRSWVGPQADHVVRFCANSDLLLNLNDPEPLRPWFGEIPVRALIDTDPAFMQIANLQSPERWAAAAQHTVFFTFAENLPAGRSSISDDGFPWQATRQPIDLDLWVPSPGSPDARWTTVMQWSSYAAVTHEGKSFGMKSDGFGDYFDLPSRTPEQLEIAMGSPAAPREQLADAGWHLVDPLTVSRTPWSYRQYLEQSKGEFSVAKHGYVAAASGWFSERSACYLACGRPVVVQDTALRELFPCGEGLLCFSSADEAIAQLERASSQYRRHCATARLIACECFDGRRVLSVLVERAMGLAPALRNRPVL